MTAILNVALPIPLRQLFDYLPPPMDSRHLSPGMRLLVPFGTRKIVGILITLSQQSSIPSDQLKSVIEILDEQPVFSLNMFLLCQFAAHYYHAPFGDVLFSALPTLLRKPRSRPLKFKETFQAIEHKKPLHITLNEEQQNAVEKILKKQNEFSCFLLEGVTGSGKTEVYLEVIQAIITAGKQCLVLVPEISLTPQTVARFQQRFQPADIACLHSGLTDLEKWTSWQRAKEGLVKIVIGTRSALFTPLEKLGLIIIDEEHDTSFKQQEGFRYSARDLAIKRASIEHIPIVLGSATPSGESYFHAQNRYEKILLRQRPAAVKNTQYEMIDIAQTRLKKGLAPQLIDHITQELDQHNQVLLFVNRRGYAPTIICHDCRWHAACDRCDAHLILHRTTGLLHCHYCEAKHPQPQKCPQCDSKNILALGVATERLEENLHQLFPENEIIRIDSDNISKKGSLETLLNQIKQGQKQILIGTQILAKGHDFPNVTLVAILDMDHALFSGDFRATEKMGQLLLQVAGRAGRAHKPGRVLLQTRYPNHPLLKCLLHEGYPAFLDIILQERQRMRLPPFSYLALFCAQAHKIEKANQFLQWIKSFLKKEAAKQQITLLGPIPALQEKRAGYYRVQLLLNAPHRKALQLLLEHHLSRISNHPYAKTIKWSIDIDPIDLF